MRNKLISKIAAVVMTCAVALSSVSVVGAQEIKPKKVSTPYGTMSYLLTKVGVPSAKQKGAMAYTQMPATNKAYNYVRTTLEVQKNATGKKIHAASCIDKYKANKKVGCEVESRLYRVDKLAAFSCHEVVGKKTKEVYQSLVYLDLQSVLAKIARMQWVMSGTARKGGSRRQMIVYGRSWR